MASFNPGFRASLNHVSCFNRVGESLCSSSRNISGGTRRKLVKAARSLTSSSCIRRSQCPKSVLLRILGLTQNLLGALLLLLFLCWRSWARPRPSSASSSSSCRSTWCLWGKCCSVTVLVSPSRTREIISTGRWRAHYVPNMLLNSCRNRIESYIVEQGSHYVVLIPY